MLLWRSLDKVVALIVNANKVYVKKIKDSEDCIPGVVHWRESLLLLR